MTDQPQVHYRCNADHPEHGRCVEGGVPPLMRMEKYGNFKRQWFCDRHWADRANWAPATPGQVKRALTQVEQLMAGTHRLESVCRYCQVKTFGQATVCVECGGLDMEPVAVPAGATAQPSQSDAEEAAKADRLARRAAR